MNLVLHYCILAFYPRVFVVATKTAHGRGAGHCPDLQMSKLPASCPEIESFEIAACSIPANLTVIVLSVGE